MVILTALDERKKQSVSKKYYKDHASSNTVSVFKQGQSLLKQSFVTLTRFLDIMQFINVVLKSPLPFNIKFVQ